MLRGLLISTVMQLKRPDATVQTGRGVSIEASQAQTKPAQLVRVTLLARLGLTSTTTA